MLEKKRKKMKKIFIKRIYHRKNDSEEYKDPRAKSVPPLSRTMVNESGTPQDMDPYNMR